VYLSHDLTFRGLDHVTIRFPVGHFYWWSFGTFSEIFNGECDAVVDMILNDVYANIKVITGNIVLI